MNNQKILPSRRMEVKKSRRELEHALVSGSPFVPMELEFTTRIINTAHRSRDVALSDRGRFSTAIRRQIHKKCEALGSGLSVPGVR